MTLPTGFRERFGRAIEEERALLLFERTSIEDEAKYIRLTPRETLELLALLQRNKGVLEALVAVPQTAEHDEREAPDEHDPHQQTEACDAVQTSQTPS